ncbi:DNA internalization-related competence protein ComEC/Rec2 [Candidatus Margulisiibacteriota bacterium]
MLSPILCFLFAYSLGIIAAKFSNIPFVVVLVMMVGSVSLVFYLSVKRKVPFQVIIAIVFLAGLFAYKFATLPPPKNNISNFINDKYVTLAGMIADEPRATADKTLFTLDAKKMGERSVSGKVKIYLNGGSQGVAYGCNIKVKGILSKITSTGNFGLLSYTELMEDRGVYAQFRGRTQSLKVLGGNSGNPVKKLTIAIKNKLFASLRKTLKEPYSSLLGSIIFGSKVSPLPDDIKENFRNAGVVHLLVVSGLHMSILLGVTASLLKGAGLSSRIRAVLVSVFNFMFVVMVGAGPSVIRAGIMGEVALLTNIFQRENEFYNTLAFSGLILLIMNPLNIFAVGFQLSFMATWALFYVAPAFEEKLKGKMPPFFANLISIAIAPALATSPIILYNFGQVSFVSIFANMSIIPWIQVIVVLGFFSVLAGAVFLPISMIINNFLLLLLMVLNSIVYFYSHLPFACRFFVPPALPMIVGYYIIVGWGVEMLKGKVKFKLNKFRIAFAVLAALSVLVWTFAASASSGSPPLKNELAITIIDVGQGDSILIESPSGKTMLIDGGGRHQAKGAKESIGKKIVIPYIHKRGINELDVVVLTHPHDDHVGGLASVIEAVPVKMVIDSGRPHTSYSYLKFLKLIDKKGIAYKLGRRGQTIDLGGGVKGFILYPTNSIVKSQETDLNDVSIVIKLVYKDFSMLFTGDMEHGGEKFLLKHRARLKSEVLKAGHHGSRTSTTYKFLKAVDPKYAIISVGLKNKFGHPSKEIIDRLKKAKVKIYRTDEDGAVLIRTDGKKLIFTAKKATNI